MGERETRAKKHLREITQTQLYREAASRTASRTTSVGNSRKLNGVPVRFVKGTATVRAEERCVATFGFLRALSGDGGSTMGTIRGQYSSFSSLFNVVDRHNRNMTIVPYFASF